MSYKTDLNTKENLNKSTKGSDCGSGINSFEKYVIQKLQSFERLFITAASQSALLTSYVMKSPFLLQWLKMFSFFYH